jgi:hypothetical protein
MPHMLRLIARLRPQFVLHPAWGRVGFGEKEPFMKKTEHVMEQPQPVTPGVTKGMVRQHAFEMFRDKLPTHPLTLEDWVLAEKDLVTSMDTDNLTR